jgi:putative spermidine/putrescine transport system ATP-binding protein
VVQQIAPPPVVYGQPANLHVARFMGYRNVFPMTIERQEGDRVALSGVDFPLTGTRMEPLADGRAMVALRPDDIVIGAAADGLNSIPGRVDGVEYAGRESLVDVVTPSGQKLIVKSPVPVVIGDHVRLHVAVERVLVYASE